MLEWHALARDGAHSCIDRKSGIGLIGVPLQIIKSLVLLIKAFIAVLNAAIVSGTGPPGTINFAMAVFKILICSGAYG